LFPFAIGEIPLKTPLLMISRTIHLSYEHRVFFTRGVFARENPLLRDLVVNALDGRTRSRAIVFVDEGMARGRKKFPRLIESYFEAHSDVLELVRAPTLLKGGEVSKNDWSLVNQIWEQIHQGGICRHSYVIAVGGGAILDLVGFAAATAHRGVRHIRMPATTLSQADGGVGVKNGVNYFNKKNWVGSFAVPFAIVNDLEFLRSLPENDRRAGIIEAIKVALIRDEAFFCMLEKESEAIARLEEDALEFLIRRSAELHMNHIATGGDPFELGSARPLDFGHWAAHKLEQISGFRVGHGQAVAIGMALDLIYARRKKLLSAKDEKRITALIQKLGFKLWDEALALSEGGKPAVLRGLEEFREHLGGQLTITLVTGIGQAVEVHEMDGAKILEALAELQERFSQASTL